MELSFDIWNRIFEHCESFKEKRKLYNFLPDTFKIQYPKTFIPYGDKCILNYLSIDNEKEVILYLKIGGYYTSNIQPFLCEQKQIELSFRYKHVLKTLDELFDFDIKIYKYYQAILAYNQYKINRGWKFNYTHMTIEYELRMNDFEICIKTAVIPIPEMA